MYFVLSPQSITVTSHVVSAAVAPSAGDTRHHMCTTVEPHGVFGLFFYFKNDNLETDDELIIIIKIKIIIIIIIIY